VYLDLALCSIRWDLVWVMTCGMGNFCMLIDKSMTRARVNVARHKRSTCEIK
jgi:hypothetical protein